MTSLADGLPAEVAAQVHPDWRVNEAGHWLARAELLASHGGQWVAFAGGLVVTSGRSPVEVFRAAHQTGRHPYVARVGAEAEPCRMRRASFAYDGEPLPVVSVEFRPVSPMHVVPRPLSSETVVRRRPAAPPG